MTLDRFDRLTAVGASALTSVIFVIVMMLHDCKQDKQNDDRLEERYWDGVRDGECVRDCQYTHGDILQVEVTGVVNGYGTCVCTRALGEPDWESAP